jgi:hypothetical protein
VRTRTNAATHTSTNKRAHNSAVRAQLKRQRPRARISTGRSGLAGTLLTGSIHASASDSSMARAAATVRTARTAATARAMATRAATIRAQANGFASVAPAYAFGASEHPTSQHAMHMRVSMTQARLRRRRQRAAAIPIGRLSAKPSMATNDARERSKRWMVTCPLPATQTTSPDASSATCISGPPAQSRRSPDRANSLRTEPELARARDPWECVLSGAHARSIS